MIDGQLCVIKESKELVRFVGNLNGSYHYDLGVIEDSFGIFSIRKISDLETVDDAVARENDPIMYDILKELEKEEKSYDVLC